MDHLVEERIDSLLEERPDLLPEVVHDIVYAEGNIQVTVKDVKKYMESK
jgi:hypothetical protein